MKKTIGMVSLGCPKNLVDSEVMLGLLKNSGYEIANDKEDADVLVVNTCGFIESAKKESVDTILDLARCKEGRCKKLIVTGCLAERYKDEILKEIPEVDAVIGTGGYNEIVRVVEKALEGEKELLCGNIGGIEHLVNERVLSTGKSYAYLKIAEGCDNCCTYCIIPSLRGKYRSRPVEGLFKEAETIISKGIQELILVAQDTTRYGTDIYGTRSLTRLIRELSGIKELQRIRLLYCYPEEFDQELIEEIKSNEKVCNYLDIPVQHISDKILKQMGRRGTSSDIKSLLDKLRREIPDIVLRSSLITGFPGEDEHDFELLYDFVQEYSFDRLGVFIYSREEGTPAALMKQQVPRKISRQRYNRLMELQRSISNGKNLARLNRVYDVVVDGVSGDGIFYLGRSYAEAPDIDGKIFVLSPEPLLIGQCVKVKIINTDDYDLIGEVQNEFAQ